MLDRGVGAFGEVGREGWVRTSVFVMEGSFAVGVESVEGDG